MKRRENFYRRDPQDALAGMVGLSLEERGVYNTIIDLLYTTWRPLEDNRAFIANWCGCAVQKLNPIVRTLVEKRKLIRFEEGGVFYLSNSRFEEERIEFRGAPVTRSGRGEQTAKSGEVGEKSAGVRENPHSCGDETKQNQLFEGTEKKREEKKDTPLPPLQGDEAQQFESNQPGEPSRRRRPQRAIPEGFPTAELIAEQQAAARTAGADVDMTYQAQRFRNWAVGKDARYADWSATWRNWAAKSIREAPKRQTAVPIRREAEETPDAWRKRLELYTTRERFWREPWGPSPRHPGCRVPPEILCEFGIAAPAQPLANLQIETKGAA